MVQRIGFQRNGAAGGARVLWAGRERSKWLADRADTSPWHAVSAGDVAAREAYRKYIMIMLDTSRMPARVVAALMARGAQFPPLVWHVTPNRAGKASLDAISDNQTLLGCEVLRNPEMAAAVRALLYFWNGWPDEATKHAQVAPERERKYLEALRCRQAGEADVEKALWQEIAEHPTYKPLAEYARDTIGLSTTPLLKRLREMITFAEQWEPYIFSDVHEQARSGAFDPTAEQVVCHIQCFEFELLFAHCLEAATGETRIRNMKTAAEQRRTAPPRPPVRRPVAPAKRPKPAPAPAATGEKKQEAKPMPVLQFEVLCPKCQTLLRFPEANRGLPGKCVKCGVMFLIPERKSAPADAKK